MPRLTTFATASTSLVGALAAAGRVLPMRAVGGSRANMEHMAQPPTSRWSVVYTRGDGCRELGSVVGGDRAVPSGPNLTEACVEARADLLVARRLSVPDLVPVAVPHGFAPATIESVVAAVGGGPHSRLAARVAARIADELDAPARLLSVYPAPGLKASAEEALAEAGADARGVHADAVEAANPADVVAELPLGTLLVVGAPGGNWLQRHFFGRGARAVHRAPSGSVVVRDAPERVFARMRPPAWVAPEMSVGDAARILHESTVPVVAEGRVVGLALADMLTEADPAATVSDVMIDPVTVGVTDAVEDLPVVPVLPAGAPLPVVNGEARLIGLVDPAR